MLQISLQHLLPLDLKSKHGFFGLPQNIICTYPDQDTNYSAIHLHFQDLLSFNIQNASNVKHFKS